MEKAIHHEKKSPFLLTLDVLAPVKTGDQISVRFDEPWSAMRTGHAERQIYCYDVTNVTKGHDYKVEFLEDDRCQPHGWCDCAANVVCKHIRKALNDLLARVTDFGQAVWEEVFQDCKQGNHAECLFEWPRDAGEPLQCTCPHHKEQKEQQTDGEI